MKTHTKTHLKIGSLEVFLLREGTFKLDGGTVFGGIPRKLWEQNAPPDGQNRITLGLNQLLVKSPTYVALIDTGVGTKLTPRQMEVLDLPEILPWQDRLSPLGLTPEDVTHVVFTHLHFDHTGGSTIFSVDRSIIRPAFPNARFLVQDGEWREALHPADPDQTTYRFGNTVPLLESGRLILLHGNREPLPGLHLEVSGGHTRFHQMVRISDRGCNLFVPGDVCPTSFHLNPAWRTSEDLYPLEVTAARQGLLKRVLNKEHIVVFGHDPAPHFFNIVGTLDRPKAVACDAVA